MNDFEVLDQQDRLRTIVLDNGSKINIKREDPYGFWTIHYDKGQVPRELSGQYTSDWDATVALRGYVDKKNEEASTKTGVK